MGGGTFFTINILLYLQEKSAFYIHWEMYGWTHDLNPQTEVEQKNKTTPFTAYLSLS